MKTARIVEIIAAATRATLIQIDGLDPAELDNIAKAIANNAAMIIAIELEMGEE